MAAPLFLSYSGILPTNWPTQTRTESPSESFGAHITASLPLDKLGVRGRSAL